MKPTIETSVKGKISIQNKSIEYDFYINSRGEIIRRIKTNEKKGDTSMQIIGLDEAGFLYDPSINEMIIGSDSKDELKLSNEATDFFEEKRCKIKLLPLNEAITYWNRYEGYAVGLFHVTH